METIAETRAVRYTDIVPAKKTVIGSKVVNAQNEDLGKIEDLVIDAGAGRIAYAVFFNLGENHAVLHLDKKQLENAPVFDKDNWPNMADSTWGTNIYKHYGYTALLGRSVRQDEHRDENRRRHCLRLVVAEGG